MRSHAAVAVLVAAFAVGCGDSDGGDGASASGGTGGSAGSGGGAGASGSAGSGGAAGGSTGNWETLIDGDWTLEAGDERYVCVRKTVETDLYIRAFDAISPPGTHHTVLTVGPASGPDGISECDAFTNLAVNLTGSGVGTNAFEFPEGVAMKIEAGDQLLLNLHLFNVTNETITGVSGTRTKLMLEEDVEHLAEGTLMGTTSLQLPPGQVTTQLGVCTLNADSTLFGVLPHMHQLGTHMKVEAFSSVQGIVTLSDRPYDFEEQRAYPVDNVQMLAGDKVRVECTYKNTTSQTVFFGDSSLAEMCFAGVMKYPATSPFFLCTQ